MGILLPTNFTFLTHKIMLRLLGQLIEIILKIPYCQSPCQEDLSSHISQSTEKDRQLSKKLFKLKNKK